DYQKVRGLLQQTLHSLHAVEGFIHRITGAFQDLAVIAAHQPGIVHHQNLLARLVSHVWSPHAWRQRAVDKRWRDYSGRPRTMAISGSSIRCDPDRESRRVPDFRRDFPPPPGAPRRRNR